KAGALGVRRDLERGSPPAGCRARRYDSRMLTRRIFLHGALAGAAAFAAPRASSAATYDLIVKGGRVIDPSRRFDAIADVAISNACTAAVQRSIAASSAADVLDAGGRLVTPGLIDIHTHVRSAEMPS